MKLITKILDKYYADKLADKIRGDIQLKSFINVKIEKTSDFVFIKVKKPKYKDSEYHSVYHFHVSYAFELWLNYREVIKETMSNFNTYLRYCDDWL